MSTSSCPTIDNTTSSYSNGKYVAKYNSGNNTFVRVKSIPDTCTSGYEAPDVVSGSDVPGPSSGRMNGQCYYVPCQRIMLD